MSFYQTAKLKGSFGWVGGKSRLAKDIVGLMPLHGRYIEVFAGGLSVLYAKPSRTDLIALRKVNKALPSMQNYTEVINDINGDLINLHTIIKTRPQSLALELKNMLYSRELFTNIKNARIKPRNNIQRAAFFYYMLAFSFSSKMQSFAMAKSRPAKNIYKDFSVFSRRLKYVCIEHMDFRELIRQYDNKDALFYLDPPYVGYEHYYSSNAFGLKEHRELAHILSNIKAKFILSYNDCELIRELYKDFRILQTKEILYTINGMRNKRVRETLVLNY